MLDSSENSDAAVAPLGSSDREGTMVGVGVVLVLATLVVPIALILAAVVFDILFLGWFAARTIRTRVIPAIGERLVRVGGVPQRRTA